MSIFDSFFFNVFKHYKDAHNKNANQLATFYISILQISFLLLLGVFFAGFFKQMHVDTMSQSNVWLLFILTSIFIFFKNWMQYSGRKRMLINVKMLKKKSSTYSIWTLWLIPVGCLALALIIFQAV